MKERFRLVADMLHGARARYAAAGAAVLLATVFGYLFPLVLRFTVDSVLGDRPPSLPRFLPGSDALGQARGFLRQNLWVCGAVMLACAAGQGLFSYLKTLFASQASEHFAENLRNALYDRINRLPFVAHGRPETGDILQRCSSDTETVRLFIESQAVEIWRILMMIGVALPLMISLDIPMTLASTFLLPPVLICSAHYFVRVKDIFGQSVALEAKMTSKVQENVTGVRLVRAFGRADHEIQGFGEINAAFRDKRLQLIRTVASYWAFSAFLCMSQITVTVLAGTLRVVRGDMTLGTLTVFIAYVSMLVWPIRMLGHVLSDLGRSHVSMGRVLQILHAETEEEKDTEHLTPEIKGHIEFRDVAAGYDTDSHPALTGVTFSAKAGQTIAVVGPTGSGKSTLVNLLPRLLDYTAGSIRVDGYELRRIDRRWIRSKIGIVLQEPFLFSRSIRDNIALGMHEEPSDRDILEAAETATIHDTIEHTFAEGYRTVVGERGVTLSGGQRQRIAIARAILPDPPILIFDDSLSAVDAETDLRIRRALHERKGRATTFIISHRISTVSQADEILVLEKGVIADRGTHEELASRPGLYQRICRIQDMQGDGADADPGEPA